MLNASTESLLKREAEEKERSALSVSDYGSTKAQEPQLRRDNETAGKGKETVPDLDHRSLLDKLARLGGDSKSLKELSERLGNFFVGSVLWSVILTTTVVIPFVMLIVGSVYLGQCPRQPLIPVFLVVGGATSGLNNILNLVERFRRLGDASPPRTLTPVGIATLLLNCFAVAWLIAGCVWVYGSYRPSNSVDTGALYCHPSVYLLAFWVLTGFLLFLLAVGIVAGVTFGWSQYFAGHAVAARV